jgi:hypothetical protein
MKRGFSLFASKRSTKWLGYKVHLTETYGEETPNIITNVQMHPVTIYKHRSYCVTKNH